MAKSKTPNIVSDGTLDGSISKTIKMTPEGFEPDSEEAKTLDKQRRFLNEIAKPSFQIAKDARRKYDQEWIARNLFWRGYQFSRYLPQTQTVVLSSRQNARVPINLVTAYMRAIRNQVTSFRPKWETMPRNPSSEEDKVQARYEGRLLDYYWDSLRLKFKTKETITQALLYSVGGPWKIGWDAQKKKPKIWLCDTFDFFIDPLAEEYNDEDPEYCVEAVRQSVSEVTHNPQFNIFARKEVSGGDASLAASEYKQFMIQAIRMVSPRTNENSPTVILKEGYFKKRKDNGDVYMVRVIWTDQNLTPLYYEEIDTDEFPYVLYKGDLNPKDIYGESWIKHTMAINRVINSLESSAFEYNYRVAKGRIVVDKDSGVRQIHNVHGEIISKNRGSEVKSLDMSPLPVAVPQQIERMWRYLEDVSGLHEASLGRIPTGVKTGVGIAELKQADATSQDDLVDNLEDFLEEVARKLLKVVANNMETYQIVRDLGVREGDEKYFAIIGEGFNKKKGKKDQIPGKEGKIKMGADWFDIAEIKKDNHIRVNVGSWLGYTKEAMQQKVIQYYQLQLIDQPTALRLLEFGDIDTIVQNTRLEALLKRPAQPGPNGEPGVDQYSLAMSENDMMLDGSVATPRDAIALVEKNQDHLVHIAVHQEALGRGMDEIVGVHLDAHQHFLGVSNTNSSAPASNATPPGPQAPTQPSAMPSPAGMPSAPAPMGAPPGQNLPQQNVQQAMTQLNGQAGTAVGPTGGQ